MRDKRDIIRAFSLFEEERSELIGTFRLEGFLIWPIVKSALCYNFIRTQALEEQVKIRQGRRRILYRKIEALLYLVSASIKIYLKCRKNKETVLFFTKTIDKLTRVNGKYFNFLTDGFITGRIVKHFVYTEESVDGDYREPYTVPIDLKLDHLNILSLFFRKKEQRKKNRALATAFAGHLNQYLSDKKFPIQVDIITMEELLNNFLVEYRVSNTFLRFVKPSLIITSEKIGTGFYAAACEQNIKTIDLQHGIIDSSEPMYQYSSKLKSFKTKMLLPDIIGLWGRHHKCILLQKEFWDEKDLYVLGNQRLHINRAKLADHAKENIVLFPTQWTVFEETKQLLEALARVPYKDFKFILKLHPAEPASFKEYFFSFSEKNDDWMAIAAGTEDIYELFAQARLVVGFNSASMIEAAALKTPSITLTTPQMPYGIYDFLGVDIPMVGIKAVALENLTALIELIHMAITNVPFYRTWQEEAAKLGAVFFAEDYEANALALIENEIRSPRLQAQPINTCAE